MSQARSSTLRVHVAMNTDIGQQREQNQDAIGHLMPTDADVLDRLGQIFVLADGVGGLAGGDLASQYAVSTIISRYYEQEEGEPPERLARAVAEANRLIYAEGQAQETPVTMATTVVTAVVRGEELIVGSVGDSPAYLMRDGQPRKLTRDHTLAEQQREAGQAASEGGQRLVRALGVAPTVKVDIITGRVHDGDVVVLCSDGLTRYLTPDEIERITAEHTVERSAAVLIEQANERGGADNISVIVLHLEDTEELARLPFIRDPMEDWGRPRRVERTRVTQPTLKTPPSAPNGESAEPAPNILSDLWRLLRGNLVLSVAGMSVVLVLFVIIMLVLANIGGHEAGTNPPDATAIPAEERTATVTIRLTATAELAVKQTEEAFLAATAARSAQLTLTPPTPIPTYGPQMISGTWFRVLDGDPIQTYVEPRLDVSVATPLQPGSTYRISEVVHQGASEPWYEVIDNLGEETRWVNAPSLHLRVVAVGENGLPLDQQPEDVPPPSAATPTATVTATATASEAAGMTPSPANSTPVTPTGTATPTATPAGPTATPTVTPTISYGAETWSTGTQIELKAALDLCRVPDVNACDAGQATSGEIGTIVNGPEAGGEHWWWEVEFQDGRAGWIAQVLLGQP